MKRLVSGIAALASIFATGAFAADLAPKIYTKAPAPAVVIYDWTGWYIGGNLGYSWGRSQDTSIVTDPAGTVLATGSGRSNLNGTVGGGQFGYNLQLQNMVLGFEADIQGTGEKGSRTFSYLPIGGGNVLTPVSLGLTQQINWFGTARGRVGALFGPKVLAYFTGGVAYGSLNSSETIGASPLLSSSTTNIGWTIGAGIEGVIANNWTAKLEYLYVDLGTMNGSFTTPAAVTSSYSSHITDNIVRVGVNYKFGGPVAAKY